MPAVPGPVTDEKDALLAFMRQERQNLRTIAHGPTDDEPRSTASASALHCLRLRALGRLPDQARLELIAATDGMPEAPWLKPWSRAAT